MNDEFEVIFFHLELLLSHPLYWRHWCAECGVFDTIVAAVWKSEGLALWSVGLEGGKDNPLWGENFGSASSIEEAKIKAELFMKRKLDPPQESE